MEAIIKELNTCGDWVVACRHWLELRRLVGWGLSPDVEVRFGVESHSVVFISALPSTPPRHPRLVSYIQSVARVSRPLIALQNDLHALVAHPLLSAVLPRPLPPVQLHHVHAPPRPRHSTAQHAPAAFPPDRPYSLLVSLILPVSAPTPAAALVSSPPPPPQPFLPLLPGIRHHRHSSNRNHVLFTTRYKWKAPSLPRRRLWRLEQKEGPHR